MKVALWLHQCPDCDSELIEALDGIEREDGSWEVRLRCPECWLDWGGIASNGLIEDLERRVALAHAQLEDAAERVTRENMEGEIDRFAAALEADAIVPMDFGWN